MNDSEINKASAAAAIVKVVKFEKKTLKGLYCNMCTGKGIQFKPYRSIALSI